MMKNRAYKLIILTLIMAIFNSCDSGGEDTNWGIDHETSKQIPRCNGDKTTTTNAIKVYAKQEIEHQSSGTVLRIWHYQNGDKLVCTVTGKAVINVAK